MLLWLLLSVILIIYESVISHSWVLLRDRWLDRRDFFGKEHGQGKAAVHS